MEKLFKNSLKVAEFNFGFKTGLALSLTFMTAFILSLRAQLDVIQIHSLIIGWFAFWGLMQNLNKKENRKIAKGFLLAQGIIVFLGMLICFDLLESLFLSLMSVFAFSMGCLTITAWKWIVIKLGLRQE